MTQPDAAGTRSLEEILASIRKSLSEETVDGIVELSAAAAAAARAEATPANGGKGVASAPRRDAKAAPAGDSLSDKLAGALNSTEPPVDDLADVLAEPAPQPTASLKSPASPASPSAADEAKDPLWFLRPGAPEEPSREVPRGPVPKLEIDPFSPGRVIERASTGNEAEPVAPSKEQQIVTTPRLDPERLNRINTLKATPAAEAVPVEASPKVAEPPAAEPPPPAASPAPAAPSEPALTETGILSRREAPRVPLFGGATDKRKPIVSAPLPNLRLEPVADVAAAVPAVDSEPEPSASAATDTAEDEPAPVLAAEPSEPVPVAEIAEEMGADPEPTREGVPEASVAAGEQEPAPAADASVVPGSNRPLEEMIAAVLEPVLQRLLEKNLTPMLEAMVRREVEKALQDIGR